MTLLDAFGKAEAEGNLSESRAKKVSGKQGYGGSSYGYGSGGKWFSLAFNTTRLNPHIWNSFCAIESLFHSENSRLFLS